MISDHVSCTLIPIPVLIQGRSEMIVGGNVLTVIFKAR